MDVVTLTAALAEVKKICAERDRCTDCPFVRAYGCACRVPDYSFDDWPSNWPIGEERVHVTV